MKMRSKGMPHWVMRQSRALAELDPLMRQKLNDAKGRLHWLIEFCQRDDLASLKKNDMNRLYAEMSTFVLHAWQPGAISWDKPDAPRLIETATKVRDGLRALMGEVSGGWRLPFSELNGMISFLPGIDQGRAAPVSHWSAHRATCTSDFSTSHLTSSSSTPHGSGDVTDQIVAACS